MATSGDRNLAIDTQDSTDGGLASQENPGVDHLESQAASPGVIHAAPSQPDGTPAAAEAACRTTDATPSRTVAQAPSPRGAWLPAALTDIPF